MIFHDRSPRFTTYPFGGEETNAGITVLESSTEWDQISDTRALIKRSELTFDQYQNLIQERYFTDADT